MRAAAGASFTLEKGRCDARARVDMLVPAGNGSAEGSTCRTCGGLLAAGSTVCAACGAAHGEANRCPHCHVVADVQAHASLGFTCRVCGGPRLALGGAATSGGEKATQELVRAKQQHTRHLLFSGAGLSLVGVGALAFCAALVVALAAAPTWPALLLALAAGSAPLLAGLWALRQAAAARDSRRDALHAAQLGALALIQTTETLDAPRVADMLQVGPERAELLLAELSVAAMLEPMPVPKLRIQAPEAAVAAAPLAEHAPPTVRSRGTTELGE